MSSCLDAQWGELVWSVSGENSDPSRASHQIARQQALLESLSIRRGETADPRAQHGHLILSFDRHIGFGLVRDVLFAYRDLGARTVDIASWRPATGDPARIST